MFECHGWAVIQASAYDVDTAATRAIYELLTRRLAEIGKALQVASLSYGNGMPLLAIAASHNHRDDTAQKLFEFITSAAPGSYGLLYIWDDEDPPYKNEFRVWRLAKGKLVNVADPFLSPCIPVIEDPEG